MFLIFFTSDLPYNNSNQTGIFNLNRNEFPAPNNPGIWYAIAIVLVAIITTYFGVRYSVERPIQVTQTAEAARVTETASAVQSLPHIAIQNKLVLPIRIFINGDFEGVIYPDTEKLFVMVDFSSNVEWNVVKQKNSDGIPIGDDMGGIWKDVQADEVLVVDNYIDGSFYFYPILTNNTDEDCVVSINDDTSFEDEAGTVNARKANVGLGYFLLFSDSNVTLYCNGIPYFVGIHLNYDPAEGDELSIVGEVEESTGVFYIRHNN